MALLSATLFVPTVRWSETRAVGTCLGAVLGHQDGPKIPQDGLTSGDNSVPTVRWSERRAVGTCLGAVLGHLGAFFKLFFGLLDLIFAIFSFLGPFSAVL